MGKELELKDILTGPYTLRSLQPCDLSCCNKEQILEYFENSYSLNESIFAALRTEDVFYKAPDRLRLPLIFYYAHTAVVYINKLMLAGLIEERVNYEYETLFETGVDEMSWDDTENFRMGGSFQWPSLKDVVEFRLQARNVIRKVIEATPLDLPVTQDSPWWAVFMGFEHERIHIETSSVLIRQLPISMVRTPEGWTFGPQTCGDGLKGNPLIQVDQTDVVMGKPVDFPSYGWDNEYPELHANVPRFEASKYPITNGEFLAFVKAGGYQKEEFWSKEGWQWRTYRQAIHPTFWVCDKGCISGCGGVLAGYSHCRPDPNSNKLTQDSHGYRYRTFCEEMTMPWDWPVVVNYHEAKAYAVWRGPDYRLLTEAESQAIRTLPRASPLDAGTDTLYQDDLHENYNINMSYGSSTPVNMYPANKKGFHDVFGNVWQWVEDNFNGFPGYKTHYLYDDYSSPTLDGKHNILVGGSWISTGVEASRFARYGFRRHFFQHAGFRLARSLAPGGDLCVRMIHSIWKGEENENVLPIKDVFQKQHLTTNVQFLQDTRSNVENHLFDEYCIDQYSLSKALSETAVTMATKYGAKLDNVLDIGCGCGRSTFELSKHCNSVIGSDFCGMFMKVAEEILAKKQYLFSCPKDGCKGQPKQAKTNGHQGCATLANLPKGTEGSKITLKQFTWVPNELSGFDLVLHHCLDRVSNKKAWLVRLWDIIKPNGIVVISGRNGWTKEKLQPMIGNKLQCVETVPVAYSMDYTSTEPDSETIATVWQLKKESSSAE
ncbi:uncharacterized protein [Diadema antillarum]|uniref:uncharacterized protein n=1 Tax=Diadema antillarum TaxID=105358 RepID=UPI003A87CA84